MSILVMSGYYIYTLLYIYTTIYAHTYVLGIAEDILHSHFTGAFDYNGLRETFSVDKT